MPMARYYKLSTYLLEKYGQRVQKIPLDAGFDCPNRDGNISRQGCIFCNPQGSGSGLGLKGYSLEQQWQYWQSKFEKRYKANLFWAYLQSFTNTYGPLALLQDTFQQIIPLPGLVGACIGTRPDCLDQSKLDFLSSLEINEVWLDLGLQSSSDTTLKLINRGHDSKTFARTARLANQKGLKVCAHIIIGLPGENEQEVYKTINFLNSLPIQGIKFHNLYVCKGSKLASWWQKGEYVPIHRQTFVHTLAQAISLLRPDIIIHRLNGDPQPEELLAPDWAKEKNVLLQEINNYLEERDIHQGEHYLSDN
jgi:radical SAM protein (TIGR01212 family)